MARRCELAVVIATILAGCRQHGDAPSVAPKRAAPNTIPRTSVAMVIDGEPEDVDWSRRAQRGIFRGDDGAFARPSSDIRLLHDDAHLFVGLYAADEDIRSTDAFALTIGAISVRLDATGAVTPPVTGVRAALDRDGTLDDARDDDEEWLLEVEIPFAAVGLHSGARVPVHASRCDTPKDGIERCGAWSANLTLE